MPGVRNALARLLSTIADFPATGGHPGDVLLGTDDNAVALVRGDGTPLELDNTVTSVNTLSGAVGPAGLVRTLTYTVTGLRPGQRAGVLFTWGAPTAGETLRPTGSGVQGDPVTAARGSVGLVTGVADATGTATVAVTLTASGAVSFTTWATAMAAGADITDSQTLAFA